MATLAVDPANKRLVATLAGGDPVPARANWTVNPVGYANVFPSAAGPYAADIRPLQVGVVAVTCTFVDAAGNNMGTPAPITQDIQITSATGDMQSATIAATGAAATVPPSGVGTAPTVAAGANNGAAPPAPVVGANSDDDHGTITFGSGTGPAAGAQVVVTYSSPRPNDNPSVVLTAGNDATQPLGLEVTNMTRIGFTISTHAAPAATQGAATYAVDYQVQG